MHTINTTHIEKSTLPSPPSSPIKATKRKRALSLSFIQNTQSEPEKKCKFNYLESYLTSSSPNQCDHQYNRSLLSWACIARSTEKVKELMSNVHLDINLTSGPNLTTALHEAAFIGFERGIRLILQHSEIDLNVKDKFGQTPLHYAVQRNQTESLRALLSAGARLDLSCRYNRLPIHTAASYGFETCTRLLLAYHACHPNNPKEINLIHAKESLSDQSVIECAVVRGHLNNLKQLLELDDKSKSSSLTDLAIHWNRLDCLKILLDLGYPTSKDSLLLAVQQRKIDLVRLLVSAGKNPCLENGQNPAFLYAANHGFLEMIPFLFTLSTSRECIQQALFLASTMGLHLKLKNVISLTVKTLSK
ncbi:unnamed protein product [Rhizopus stolonifer]